MWSCRRKRRGGKTELEESKFRAAAVRKARGAGLQRVCSMYIYIHTESVGEKAYSHIQTEHTIVCKGLLPNM